MVTVKISHTLIYCLRKPWCQPLIPPLQMRRSPSNDSLVAPSTLGCKGQRKMKLWVCTDHRHVYQDCAKGLFSAQPSCPGERELCCCHWPSTTILRLHSVLIAFLLESWTCIDLGDMWSAFSVLHNDIISESQISESLFIWIHHLFTGLSKFVSLATSQKFTPCSLKVMGLQAVSYPLGFGTLGQ